MKRRSDVILEAIEECLKELYKYAQPSITWDEFVKQNKEWAETQKGPKPFEFYYLDKNIFDGICKNFVDVYNLDYDLTGTINILIDYCRRPITDKYEEGYKDENGNYHPGRRTYEHPKALVAEIYDLLLEAGIEEKKASELSQKCEDKAYKFLHMADDFYEWDHDLQTFNMNVYLGASPSSNKEQVIKNWKEYRNKDITIKDITEEEFSDEYYI